ncbi:hypothetical protein PseudUWO311_07070 [Pseudanabaena sp. UWO311]|uniref:plastocyanin/azurin family copper-binding protein n=1 Tax=Pseudanabaena sp. UWO311 TaxID=2487337 RepID=UPI00115725CB|nr:plastocyanin/azurin family copper-binding protein [Pseudanabaena sp. UWO311]TYQ27776.1 hypothetical protein PseudUWO311_07070 [Pseudanabaena sp. UWO311]
MTTSFLSLRFTRRLQSFGLFIVVIALVIFIGAICSYSANSITVTIEGFQFTPAEIEIKQGTIVTFINKDDAPHTVDPDSGEGFVGTGRLKSGESKAIAFNTLGIQSYHCAIHPSMMGKAIVK